MGKKSKMHEIAPGVYRGHAPKDMTPAEKKELARQDKLQIQMAKEAVKNLNTPRTEPVY